MYGVGAIIFWVISAVIALAGLAAIGRRLPLRVLVVGGMGLFIVFALPALDDPDPVIRWLTAPPLIALGILMVVIVAIGPKRTESGPGRF